MRGKMLFPLKIREKHDTEIQILVLTDSFLAKCKMSEAGASHVTIIYLRDIGTSFRVIGVTASGISLVRSP